MSSEKNKFIILKKIKYSEADLIIHALSPLGAKWSFMAKSALKSKKRFGGGVLEPTHFVMLTYKKPHHLGGIVPLEEANLINDFKGIRKSYDHLEFALQVLDCASHVSQEGDVHSEFLFNLVGHTLKAIEVSENLPKLKLHFYLKFMLQQGVMTPEPWMGVFLKTNLADHANIQGAEEHLSKLSYLETAVLNYIKTADV